MKSEIQEDPVLETKTLQPIPMPTSSLSGITPEMLQNAKTRLKRPALESLSLGGSLEQRQEIKKHSIQPVGFINLRDVLLTALESRRALVEEDDWDAEDEGPEAENLKQIFEWIIGLLKYGQLNDDFPALSAEADGIRDIFRHSIKTGSLNLDKLFSGFNLSETVFEKLAEIVNYCEQAFKQISLTVDNLPFSYITLFLSRLNLSQISVLESIHFPQKQQALFISTPKDEIFFSKLMKNRTLKELQWNVKPNSEQDRTMLTNIEDHLAYNNSSAVAVVAYLILMNLLPKVLVQSIVIEYLIGDKDYAPRLLKPVTLGDNCMIFLNTSSKVFSQSSQQTDVTCPQSAV